MEEEEDDDGISDTSKLEMTPKPSCDRKSMDASDQHKIENAVKVQSTNLLLEANGPSENDTSINDTENNNIGLVTTKSNYGKG